MSNVLRKKQIRTKRIAISIATIVAVVAIAVFYLVMTKSGHWLVDDDEFKHVSWVAVLDGQSADMERTDFAADLLANGKVDSVLILGRRCLRNRNNAEFYIDEFMPQGNFDSNSVFIAPHDDPSTIGEAYTIIPWLKQHKADTVLLITSAAATHRVKRIFQKLSGESPVYLTVDIHHYQYDADSWYTNRESRKSWIREWAALALSYVDLWNVGTLTPADSQYFHKIQTIKEYEDKKNPIIDLQSLLPKADKANKNIETENAELNSKEIDSPDSTKADSVKTDEKK